MITVSSSNGSYADKQKSLRVLEFLRNNSGTIKEISKETNIPESTVHKIIKKLEKTDLVRIKYLVRKTGGRIIICSTNQIYNNNTIIYDFSTNPELKAKCEIIPDFTTNSQIRNLSTKNQKVR